MEHDVRLLRISGTLPSDIAEGSRPGDWVGSLALSGDLGGLTGIEVMGSGGLFLAARYDAAQGLAVLQPAAQLDYEALGPGQATVTFSLRFAFADGSRLDDPTLFQVNVVDRDDAPPSGLGFLAGGVVAAGAIGASIGVLSVTDPDSAGPFLFRFGEEDDWRFEVVGSTLKLRDGISLGLDDVGTRPLFIEVSDGRQSAGFTLDLTVRNPDDQGSVVRLLAPGQPQQGFAQTGADGQVLALHSVREVAAIDTHGGEVRQVLLQDGAAVWLPPVREVRFTDGWLDFAPDGLAAQAAALHRAATGAEASATELATLTGALRAGTGWADLAGSLLPDAASDEAGFLATLHRSALGRDATAAELETGAARLGEGASRGQVAAELALGAESLRHQAALSPDGIWMSEAFGRPDALPGQDLGAPFVPPEPTAEGEPMDLAWFL